METCRKIFIEPNDINVLIRRTAQMRLEYPKGPNTAGVENPQESRSHRFHEQFQF